MRLFIMRHGETDWNVQKKIQGQVDIPLNDKGIKLARETGEALRGVPLDLAITSPLSRAKETARIVLEGRDVPLYEDRRIEEINFGVMEGVSGVEAKNGEYGQNYQRFFADALHYQAPPKGESIQDICQRTKEFFQELIHHRELEDKNILITTHGCAARALLQNVYIGVEDFWHGCVPPNCSISIVESSKGKARLVEEDKVFYRNFT